MNERDSADEIALLRAELAAEHHKGQAFAELSHELRTLIAGVTGLTGLLLDTELAPEQRDYVKRIRGFSDALVGLVNNVLDYSRIEAGRLELDRADLDLRRLVDEVGELCADRARAKGIELVTLVAGEVPGLRGDPTRVRQVLLNLVSNALKFTDRGEVVLRASFVESSLRSAVIRVEVRDTGVGISAEGQARLFQPFSQVRPGDAGTGSGLGLALSKKIVEAMDGTIGVDSEPGRGSTFHFTARLERRAQTIDRTAIPRVDMAGRGVLGAVGNASARACLGEMMAPLGVTFRGSGDGETALAGLRDAARALAPYDVILLDVSLPGAAELMRALDTEEAFLTLPVVLLAYPGQRWDERAGSPSDGGSSASGSALTSPDGGSSQISPGHPRHPGRTGNRATTRVISNLAKPVRQSHLHACLRTLMGSAVETVTSAPESRRGGSHDGVAPKHRAADGAATTPARRGGSAPAMAAMSPAARAEERPRVLLVEDNAVNQRVAKLMMEKRGYDVDVAADGYEAIEATGQKSYAAVLMDCHMPRCDGYSSTMEIRKRDAGNDGGSLPRPPARPRVPIIAMTANVGPGARERCLAAGMDDYVAKPVTAEALDEVLRRWVSKAPAPAPAKPPTAPVRRSSSPAIDLGMLRKLGTTQGPGEPDIVAEVMALFLQDAPARVAAIRDAVARGDYTTAGRSAHTLKGSAGHLGAKTLAALCSRFEEKVRAGAPFNVAFAVGAISDELDRVRAALDAESGAPASGES